MKDKIIIGIVGVGGMGRVHYANYQKIPEVQVAAVCDIAPQVKSVGEEWHVPAFSSITEMCRGCKLDAVDICTPSFCHHDQVMESLGLGLPTIVEKPIALSFRDAKEMLEEAEKQGVPLFVAQVLQFTKEVAVLKQAVADGRYGKPIDAHFERLTACPKWVSGGWLFDKNKSGLLPYDLHIHDLDVIVSVFGKPERFTADFTKNESKDYPEHIRIIYRYPGLSVEGEAAWFNACIPFTARWRVAFEKGMLINENGRLIGYGADGSVEEYNIQDEVLVSTGINVPPCGWYYNELKHFVDCLRMKKPSEIITREQLLTVMQILEDMSHECC